MGKNENNSVVKGGQINLRKGGMCVKGTGKLYTVHYAVLMDAIIKFSWRPLGGSERCNNYIFKRMSVLEAMG